MAATDRPQCCWTHCTNEQGVGTWTEINGETLPVCEDHWFGNLDRARRQTDEIAALLREGGWDGTDVVAGVKGLIQWAEHLRENSVQDRRELG